MMSNLIVIGASKFILGKIKHVIAKNSKIPCKIEQNFVLSYTFSQSVDRLCISSVLQEFQQDLLISYLFFSFFFCNM